MLKNCATKNIPQAANFLFRQFFDPISSTYTYLLGDIDNKECILIDPVIEWVERDATAVKELGLLLKYTVNTHVHADHISGSLRLKETIDGTKSVISKASGAIADILLKPGDKIHFGSHFLEALPTPGHTNGCMTYVCQEQGIAFTGDALLIRGCGRTDFQGGCSEKLYNSVHSVIFELPDNFKLYPGHDYNGRTATTVAEEKQYNPRLTKPLNEFVKIMKNLNLSYPRLIDRAVPANLLCGVYEPVITK